MAIFNSYVNLPEGILVFVVGRSLFLMGKSTISTGPFSIAMLELGLYTLW